MRAVGRGPRGRGVGTGRVGEGRRTRGAEAWAAWAGRGGPAGRGLYGGAAGLRGPAPRAGQVIGFYFKLHFVLSEVGWEGRRTHSGGRLCKSPHLSWALLLRGGSGRWVPSAGGSGGRGACGLRVRANRCLGGGEARMDVGLFLEAQMCPWAGAGLPGCPLSNKGLSAWTSGSLAVPT